MECLIIYVTGLKNWAEQKEVDKEQLLPFSIPCPTLTMQGLGFESTFTTLSM